MNATEELRRMLDERGEPYTTNDDMGCRETSWRGFTAYQLTPDSKLIMHPTPEQAIAATLGSEREKALEELVQDWQALYEEPDYGDCCRLMNRMRELGIEVVDDD